MTAKDLIKQLEKHPEWNVTVSVDISTSEEDYDNRVFGEDVVEVVNDNSSKEFTICLTGYDNYKVK